MTEKGHDCVVAVPGKKETAGKYMEGEIRYKPVDFHEVHQASQLFPNHKPADIIHAWTPREIVRKQFLECKKQSPSSRLVLHLEDNETVLLQKITGLPVFLLKLLPPLILSRIVSDLMSHPRHYRKFIRMADGITIIMDTLIDFVSRHQPHLILWPIIHPELFSQTSNNSMLKTKLGINENEVVLAYTGNVHPSNADEVRTLYMAIGIANKNGVSTKLIRTGTDICKFLRDNEQWVKNHVIELGFIDRDQFSDHLALADILVQPGKPGKFNDYRLPSKIPEFLATGKPVVVPNSNIGRFLKDDQEAIILKTGDAQEIVAAIKRIEENSNLKKIISKGGREFVYKNFNKEIIVGKLENFYNQVLNQ